MYMQVVLLLTFVKRCCIIKMYTEMLFLKSMEVVPIFWSCVNGCERRILKVVKKWISTFENNTPKLAKQRKNGLFQNEKSKLIEIFNIEKTVRKKVHPPEPPNSLIVLNNEKLKRQGAWVSGGYRQHLFIQSLSCTANCYDNARVESFLPHWKKEK